MSEEETLCAFVSMHFFELNPSCAQSKVTYRISSPWGSRSPPPALFSADVKQSGWNFMNSEGANRRAEKCCEAEGGYPWSYGILRR